MYLSDFPVSFQLAAEVSSISDYEIELFEDTLNFCSRVLNDPSILSKISTQFHEVVSHKNSEETTNMVAKIIKVQGDKS